MYQYCMEDGGGGGGGANQSSVGIICSRVYFILYTYNIFKALTFVKNIIYHQYNT